MKMPVDDGLLSSYQPPGNSPSPELTASNVERERARMGIAGLMG